MRCHTRTHISRPTYSKPTSTGIRLSKAERSYLNHQLLLGASRFSPSKRRLTLLLLVSAVCSDGYTAQFGFTCSKSSNSTSGVVVVAVLIVVSVFVAVSVVVYVMSREAGYMERGGLLGRLLRSVFLQSVKIVIVAWQILTQVRARATVQELRVQGEAMCLVHHVSL